MWQKCTCFQKACHYWVFCQDYTSILLNRQTKRANQKSKPPTLHTGQNECEHTQYTVPWGGEGFIIQMLVVKDATPTQNGTRCKLEDKGQNELIMPRVKWRLWTIGTLTQTLLSLNCNENIAGEKEKRGGSAAHSVVIEQLISGWYSVSLTWSMLKPNCADWELTCNPLTAVSPN